MIRSREVSSVPPRTLFGGARLPISPPVSEGWVYPIVVGVSDDLENVMLLSGIRTGFMSFSCDGYTTAASNWQGMLVKGDNGFFFFEQCSQEFTVTCCKHKAGQKGK